MKKILSLLLTIIFTFSFTYGTVFSESNRTKDPNAVVTETKEEKTPDVKEENPEEDKKTDAPIEVGGPDIKGEAAFLINPSTGVIIYEKNADARMFPASTTKIMTAYLALTHLDLNKECVASAVAVDIDRDGSNMGISQGEILTVRQLIDSLVIHSANDAANVLAEETSGSIAEFVNLMNATAKELGMSNTHFENPHGYHSDNHYTTARDMAILACKAMENETFAEMVGMKRLTIPPTNKYNTERVFSTRNALINPYSDISLQYRFATGIKTGHTSNAGYCFVGSATRNDMDLISVVFKSTSYNRSFIDTKNLFEYAYSKYRMRTVIKGDELASTCNVRWAWGKEYLILKTNKDVKTILPRDNYSEELLTSKIEIDKKITAPVKEGDVLGTIKYFYDDELVAKSPLYASRSVSRNYFKQLFSYLLSGWFLTALGIFVVIIFVNKFKVANKKKNRYHSK